MLLSRTGAENKRGTVREVGEKSQKREGKAGVEQQRRKRKQKGGKKQKLEEERKKKREQ